MDESEFLKEQLLSFYSHTVLIRHVSNPNIRIRSGSDSDSSEFVRQFHGTSGAVVLSESSVSTSSYLGGEERSRLTWKNLSKNRFSRAQTPPRITVDYVW